jgi:hypothetical protein
MRSLLSILAGVVVVTVVVSATLWRELRTERQLTADLRGQLVDESSAARPFAPPTHSAPESMPMPVATPTRNDATAGAVSEATSEAAAPCLRPASPVPVSGIRLSAQQLLVDPEYRNAVLAQTRLSLQNSHPGLIEELGLSGSDADELFTLLAENQIGSTNGLFDGRNLASTDPATNAERERLQRENRARLDESLVALMGSDRHAQYQDYQRTRGARSTVTAYGNTLVQANHPLSASQSRALISALATEQQRQQGGVQTIARNLSSTTNALDQIRLQEEQLNRQEETNRRMLGVMATHLAPEQLETLRAQFESQIALSRASLRVRRERDRVAQVLQ